jgi:CHAT domain-containing protein/Flp pilus assembly protein TadD
MGQARDYEALIRELLAGVASGWSYGNVIVLLMTKGVDETDLALWLRDFAEGLSLERDRELIEQLKLLGKMTPGKLASEAFSIVARLDRSYEQNSELLNHEAWISTGIDLSEQGMYEEGITSFDRAIEIKPDDYQAWYNRGVALLDLVKYEEPLVSSNLEIEFNSNYYQACSKRGVTLVNLDRYEDVISSFDQAIKINPDKYEAWYNRGVALVNLDRYEDAISSFDQAIKINPDYNYHEAWYNRGVALVNLDRYEDAISSFDQAIEIKSDKYEAWSNRGFALNNLGRDEDAITSYDRATKIKPDIHNVWAGWGDALVNLGRYEEAIKNYDRAFTHIHCSTHPKGWGYLQHEIGRIHYREGNKQLLNDLRFSRIYYDRALIHYHKALTTLTREEFPKLRLDTLIDTAKVYLAQHNTPAAHQYKTEAFEILQDLVNAQPTFEGKKRLLLEYTSLRQLDVDLFIANGDNINALIAAELEKNNCLTWLLSALTDKPISPSYDKMRQLLGIKSASTTLNIRGLEGAITLPLAKNSPTGIVYWHLSPDNLTTFILTANDSQPLVWESDRRQQAQQLAKWIKEWDTQYRDYGSKKSVATQPSPNGEVIKDEKEHHPWRKNLPDYLTKLSQILEIDKICAQLPSILTHLILIPHSDLHRFPLHTLFLTSAKLPNLQSCIYLPSIQIGLNLQQRSTPTKSYAPLLSVEDPKTHQDAMPFAQIESTIVRHLLQPNTHINSKSADLATVENALKQPHASFHFTGHAAYNSCSPEASALTLTNEPLTAKRISQLDLSSYNLITLAACETAITGRENINTEYVGLTSAFLQAGAANIFSTLWQVDEIANAWFTIYFYQQLLSGKSPAVALAITQRWLQTVTWQELVDWLAQFDSLEIVEDYVNEEILEKEGKIGLNRSTKYSHPYYWAAFTLTGQG